MGPEAGSNWLLLDDAMLSEDHSVRAVNAVAEELEAGWSGAVFSGYKAETQK